MRDSRNQELPFLAPTIDFPELGTAFQLCKPLNDYRVCHDGTPVEARVVFSCRQVPAAPAPAPAPATATATDQQQDNDNFVVKIKVQVAAPNSEKAAPGPSTTTTAELAALRRFTQASNHHVPHLVCYRAVTQPEAASSPLPGGFITYTVMTKLPGHALVDRYWSSLYYTGDDRQEISQHFIQALQSVRALGIEPKDCALRNVMWDPDTKRCGIVDFELWEETTTTTTALDDQQKEQLLQQWGLARRPAPKSWWHEWSRLNP